jgi:hypothetical protein
MFALTMGLYQYHNYNNSQNIRPTTIKFQNIPPHGEITSAMETSSSSPSSPPLSPKHAAHLPNWLDVLPYDIAYHKVIKSYDTFIAILGVQKQAVGVDI